jgi:hypothetical protein
MNMAEEIRPKRPSRKVKAVPVHSILLVGYML